VKLHRAATIGLRRLLVPLEIHRSKIPEIEICIFQEREKGEQIDLPKISSLDTA